MDISVGPKPRRPPTDQQIQMCSQAAIKTAATARFVGCGQPQRVLIAGDVHGNTPWMLTLIKLASRYHCAGIVQLGDFGYWSHTPGGEKYLNHLETYLARADIWLLVSPGNHDNHTLLRRHPIHQDGYIWLRHHIAVAPFGSRWTWNNTHIGALGGAHSVDQDTLTPETDWWAGEEPTQKDANRLGRQPLDILVTHDTPAGAEPMITDNLRGYHSWRSHNTRQLLRQVVQKHHPRLVLHGHWHVRHSTELAWLDPAASEQAGQPIWAVTQVEGLAADIQRNHSSWGILCLDGDGQFRFVGGNRAATDLHPT